MRSETVRVAWLLVMAVGMVVPVMGGGRVRGQDVGGAGDAAGENGEKTVEEKKAADDKPQEKKDPTDIKNALGGLDLVRGFQQLVKPVKQGTWATIVNQPYLPAAVKARKLLFHGQYVQAEAAYNGLLKEEAGNQEYVENGMEAVLRQGHGGDVARFEKRWEGLAEAQKSSAKMVRLRAEAYVMEGKGELGLKVLRAFVEGHGKPGANEGAVLHAYVMYGEMLERSAQYAAAAGVYAEVLGAINGELPTDAEAATEEAIALYRGSTLSGEGRDKHQSVMHQLAEVRTADQTYWPAMLEEAEILLACHSDAEAGQAVGQVVDLNPNEVRARFLAIEHAISQYDFAGAQTELEEAKKRTDGAMVSAYEGRLWLKERQPEKAVGPLLEAVRKDPLLPEARGWLAGAYFLLNEKGKMEEELRAIKVGDEGKGVHPVALHEAGEILRDARQFTVAEGFYLLAEKAAPWWSEPPAALAELYLEMGQEAKAQAAYDVAYKMDPYNLRAINQMKLLETLGKFATKESATRLKAGSDKPAFIVRYDAKDPGGEILAGLAIEWMEKIRPEVWGYFGVTELAEPTVIEFFPTHEEFGVRTTGLPWIGTVGASTGSVIAMDVPRDASTGGGAKNAMGTFDWARVLRHEYTHTVTLAMTNNRIPHWLTEAAAVNQEQAPRDWENCQLLCSNYRAGTLFKIADLNWGFIKPKRTIDRQLAYMESQWIYEYLVGQYGLPKMLEFLGCFRDGLTEAQAWKKAYGKTMEEMDKEFLPWAGKQIESWGLPSEPLPKRAEVEAALKKDAEDKGALFNLAWLMASGGDYKHAKEQLEKLVALEPGSVKGRELLGAVLNALKEKGKAKEILEKVVEEDPKRATALRTLGFMALSEKKLEEAEKWFGKLQEVLPLEEMSYSNLAGIYLLKKEDGKAEEELAKLEVHEQRDERIPRKLAALYFEEGKLAEAEGAAYRAVRINPYNAVNHELMAQILDKEKKGKEAAGYWEHACVLQPGIAEFWEGLAEARGGMGDLKGAREAGEKAVGLEAGSRAGRWIRE